MPNLIIVIKKLESITEFYMQEIGLIRDGINPKNSSLNLDIGLVVVSATDQEEINFTITWKSYENFNLNLSWRDFRRVICKIHADVFK